MSAFAEVTVKSPYLTPVEAAAYVRVAPDTLRKWRQDGRQQGPRFRHHGGNVVYHVRDLDAWSDRHAVTCTTEGRAAVAAP